MNRLKGELSSLTDQNSLFEMSQKEKTEWEKKVSRITAEITRIEKELEDIRDNRIYRNAFEWRFEFPEVLNDQGDFTGFDVVIGNPPYIRQEEFSELKKYLKDSFQVYNSIADLLTYFIELGYKILKNNGAFRFIVSNKFTRANYGKNIRSFLLNNTTLTHFIDFSGIPVFDEATVDAAILGFLKQKKENTKLFYADTNKNDIDISEFELYADSIGQAILQADLSENSWAFESGEVLKIKDKVERQGIPLNEWNININRGILTGLNEAFIIDGKKKDELVAIDPKSADIIKPMLRGRDIQKYLPEFHDLWLIYIPKGFTIKSILALDENIITEPIPRYGYVEYVKAWKWFENKFPIIAEYLFQFKNIAEKRTDMGDYWWEQRACAYLNSFTNPKIIYPELTKFLNFSLDIDKHYYTNNKNFIFTGVNLYYLVSFFNSRLWRFCFRDNFPELLGGTRELRKVFFEQIKVKKITDEQEKSYKERITKIIQLKEKNLNTKQLEDELDQMIYQLYELTDEEINIVENSV